MATNDWDMDDDDFDFEDQQTTQQDGSDLLKKLRKAKRADEKRIKELTEQLEGLSKAQSERVIKEVLTAKGVNPKAAKWIAKDLDNITEESVNTWIEENADVIGYKPVIQDAAQQMDLAALRQQDIVTQGALTPDKAQDALQRINDAGSADEIIAMIQSGQF